MRVVNTEHDKKNIDTDDVPRHDLQKLVTIRQVVNDDVFADWFGYAYQINEAERDLLVGLIDKHRPFMLSYSEDELNMKFLAPLLNAVHFHENGILDWYQRLVKGDD